MKRSIRVILSIVLLIAVSVTFTSIGVASAVGSVKLNSTTVNVLVGKTFALKATSTPANSKLTYSSKDKSIATVDSSGVIKGVKSGSVEITVTNASNVLTKCYVVVSKSATPTKLSLFVDEDWWFYDKWEGAIPEAFNKLANVKIIATKAADTKQLPLLVASGDMPDLIDTGRYQYTANSDTSYALDSLHSKYKNIAFPVHSVRQFVNKMSDGHYYTIGCGYSPLSEYKNYSVASEGPGFFYRGDIAKELGLSFKSLADLDTAFAKVKQKYPNMTPITFNCNHQFNWLRNLMGLEMYSSGDGKTYVDKNGTLIWYIQDPGMLDFYKKVNGWYRKGYISPDNFAFKTEDDTQRAAVGGKAFAVFGYDNHCDNYNTALEKSGEKFRFEQVTNVISDKAKRYDTLAGWRGLYITKSTKNLEAAYRAVASAYSDEGMRLLMWGIEGTDYTLNQNGYPVFKYNFQGDNSVLQPRGLKYWGWLVHNAIVTGIADATSTSPTALARNSWSSHVERNPVIGLIRFATDSQEQIIRAKVDDAVKTEEIKIYMAESEASCEAAYKSLLKKLDTLGLKKLLDYGNKQYKVLKPQYDKIANSEN
jgi:putative aldouronate transport system substrate-binding protein